MFGPDYTAGCPSCSAIADGFNGFAVHLANHDVTLWAVSRAPLAKLQAYKRRMGWSFPWASSLGSDFNFDFNVAFTEEQQRAGDVEYNYRRGRPRHGREPTGAPSPSARSRPAAAPTGRPTRASGPGMSAFALEDGVIYHTYSTYARGLDGLWGMYQWLDRAPLGRNETGSGGGATTSTGSREQALARGRRQDSLSTAATARGLIRQPASRSHRPASTVAILAARTTDGFGSPARASTRFRRRRARARWRRW